MANPHVGQPVLTKVDARNNNGEGVACGLITKVKTDEDDKVTSVNVRVFLDTGADLRQTGVKYSASEPKDTSTEDDAVRDANGVQKVAWPVKK
jgi:hypothetical protein